MRKLASIQQIKGLAPIDGADMIERATVLGWSVVVKKGDFAVGDWCVFCEIDSVLPDEPEFSFLKERRLRTVKLRGQISQGIVFPLESLRRFFAEEYGDNIPLIEGLEVTELLRVTKYEPVINNLDAKGLFPRFVPKTDETRIQSDPSLLLDFGYSYSTEKLDGQSGTFFNWQGQIGFCSRNFEQKPETNNQFTFIGKSLNIPSGYAVQGEIIGPKIQSNKYKRDGYEFYVFNVYDISAQTYLKLADKTLFCQDHNLNQVPFLESLFIDERMTIAQLEELATGKSALNPDTLREGIVIRNYEDDSKSFKVISPYFLLKYKE